MNALSSGDVLAIPDKYRVQFVSRGKPLANLPYELLIDGSTKVTGVTDHQGVVESFVPAGARKSVLRVDRSPKRPLKVAINFGGVDSIEEISSVQKRLLKLGCDAGKPDGTLTDQTRAALPPLPASARAPSSRMPWRAATMGAPTRSRTSSSPRSSTGCRDAHSWALSSSAPPISHRR